MPPRKRPPIERFTEKIRSLDNGCMEWTAYIGENGYGRFYIDGKGALAHRWSYEFHIGPIAAGLVIDHRCRHRACVNPAHLEAVTQSQNVLRGVGPRALTERHLAITHCPQSHPYDATNTYIDRRGARACLTCKRAQSRSYYERNRELVIARSRQRRAS